MYRIAGKFGRGKFPSKNTFARNTARTATCKIPTKSHKILQECKKKDLFLQFLQYFLQERFYSVGKSSMIRQTKTIQLDTYNNLLADLLIYQTSFCQMLEKS